VLQVAAAEVVAKAGANDPATQEEPKQVAVPGDVLYFPPPQLLQMCAKATAYDVAPVPAPMEPAGHMEGAPMHAVAPAVDV